MFDATKRKFSDVSFESYDLDEPAGQSQADKYGVKGIPHVVFLDGSGNVIFNGSPQRDEDSFAAQIQRYH